MSNMEFGEADNDNTIMDSSTIDNTEDESDELFSGNDYTSHEFYLCVCSTVAEFFFHLQIFR